jgi:hypothetical protein
MPEYRHPRADPDTPAAWTADLGGEKVAVDMDGVFTAESDAAVRQLAVAYDTTPEALRVDASGTCDVVKADGDVCGRDLPCPYHDGGDE